MRALRLLLIATALSGCSGMQRTGKWPSLAPRIGEVSPLVPRTPLGACAGCGGDMSTATPVPMAPAPIPVPADIAGRLDAAQAAIAAVAAALPAQRKALLAALRAATGTAGDSDASAAAEIERSRFETLFVPLSVVEKTLDAIEDELADKVNAQVPAAQVAALRRDLNRLEAERLAIPD